MERERDRFRKGKRSKTGRTCARLLVAIEEGEGIQKKGKEWDGKEVKKYKEEGEKHQAN